MSPRPGRWQRPILGRSWRGTWPYEAAEWREWNRPEHDVDVERALQRMREKTNVDK